MYKINIVTLHETVVFAAEELKKYLRMMMPESGNFRICFDAEASDGIRLGLMQDFGLDVSDVKDTTLDDIIYMDMQEKEGIIAGDNPRSVLLAVYDYLRENGCRWLLPGVDGEYIPQRNTAAVKRRFVPSGRYRGWVSEGTEFQQSFLAAIDFAPKLGLNTFMIEFKYPNSYYKRYYDHTNNPHRTPEPVNPDTFMQWKRQNETEITKRGLQYHDMGHGFTYEPFGIATPDGWNTEFDKQVTPEYREVIAMMNGERKICHYPINTNLCMSNPKARARVAEYAVEYARHHSNVDYLHIWLADANNNHCECDKCTVKRPSDWYVVLLNEIDEAFTRAGLDTRIVFISYFDTAWAPLFETIKNPDRFLLMLAPITRCYTETLPNGVPAELPAFQLNRLKAGLSLGESLGLLQGWKKTWSGGCISFEYHFWRAMWKDIAHLELARRIDEDVAFYLNNGFDGILEDGSQRCFFPTGLALYVYARKLYDVNLTYEQITEDYFSHAFGEDWKLFHDYLSELGDAFDTFFMSGQRNTGSQKPGYYDPDKAADFRRVADITKKGLALIQSHYNSDCRLRTVSVRLLEYHAEFANLLAEAMIPKCLGDDEEARKKLDVLVDRMGRHEQAIEMYYDHCLAVNALRAEIFDRVSTSYMDVEMVKKKK